MSVSLNDIIPEVLPYILQWLSPRQLSGFTVNKYLYENASNDAIWKQLCLERKITPLEGRSFKQTFLDFSRHSYRFLSAVFKAKQIALPGSSMIERRDAIDGKLCEESTLLLVLSCSNSPPELIRVLLVKYLETKPFFSIKLFSCALKRKLPEETLSFIMDHCKSGLDSPSLLELMKQGRFNGKPLKIELLSLFFHYKDLFLKLYLQSKSALTASFLNVMVVYYRDGGSLEIFHDLLKRMKEEGVKFTARQCKNLFKLGIPLLPPEVLKLLIAQCEDMPAFLIRPSLMPRREIELKHLLDAGVPVNNDLQYLVLGLPLTQVSIDLLSPHIDFRMVRLRLLLEFNNFKVFLTKMQEGFKANNISLTDYEFFHLNLSIVHLDDLLIKINQCDEKLNLFKEIVDDYFISYLRFFEDIVLNKENLYINLNNVINRLNYKISFAQLAIVCKRPAENVLALLDLSIGLKLSEILLAAQLEYSSETMEKLICSIVEVDNNLEWYESDLISLRSLLSLENYALLIKRCKLVPETIISKFMRDNDKEALQVLIDCGIKMSHAILKNALCNVELFEMLLEAADPQVSLSALLKDAQSPYVQNHKNIKLLEEKIAGS